MKLFNDISKWQDERPFSAFPACWLSFAELGGKAVQSSQTRVQLVRLDRHEAGFRCALMLPVWKSCTVRLELADSCEAPSFLVHDPRRVSYSAPYLYMARHSMDLRQLQACIGALNELLIAANPAIGKMLHSYRPDEFAGWESRKLDCCI